MTDRGDERIARAWVLAAVLGGAGWSTGCEDSGVLVSLQPEIEVIPPPGTELVFDEVVFGVREDPAPNILTVLSRGSGPLELRAVDLEGEGADQLRVSSFPDRIAVGADGEIFLRFEPTVTGTATAELVLRTNDLDESELRWPVRGSARDPCRLELSPPHQLFTLNEVREVTVTAASSRDCLVTDALVDESLFRFVDLELPFLVPAGRSAAIRVRHEGFALQAGRPVRRMIVKEAEGSEAAVSLEAVEPLFGCLEIFPRDRLEFGTIPSDGSSVRTVTVVNSGCARPARVVSADVVQGQGQFRVENDLPISLRPGEQVRLQVRYQDPLFPDPIGDGGRLVLLTNDAALPSVTLFLKGFLDPPNLEVFPREVDFGTVAYRNPREPQQRSECSSGTEVVQLYSTGNSPVTLSDVYVDPARDPLFQIASVTLNGQPIDFTQPFRIPRDQEVRTELVFSPTRTLPAEHESVLVFEHDGPGRRTEVLLRGRGAPDGPVEEVFRQLPGPKADLLWVIDDSCSMFDEQARLISNLSRFVAIADQTNADYQMGVVDTDGASSSAGRLKRCFPAPALVGTGYGTPEERQAAFECMFDVGLQGGPDEQGLGAAKRALERALYDTSDANPNQGLVREDASLSVVVVTDEDDSTELASRVVEQFFLSVKGFDNPEQFRFHSIIYPTTSDEDCEESFFGTPGFRYADMSRRTGGLIFNICRDDWRPILDNLGIDTFIPKTRWSLSQTADPATMTVVVDGVPVPRDSTNGWSFDLTSNRVQFNGDGVPPAGAEVRVRYQGLCRP